MAGPETDRAPPARAPSGRTVAGGRPPLVALALAALYAATATLLSGRGGRESAPSARLQAGSAGHPDRPASDTRTAEPGRAPDGEAGPGRGGSDVAPGDEHSRDDETSHGIGTYAIGLALATVLTVASFYVTGTTLIWGPGIPLALLVLAIAQMGVHLVFFLHITTGPDNANNVLALAFGVLIVALVLIGSIWIMANLNHNTMPMGMMQQMQR